MKKVFARHGKIVIPDGTSSKRVMIAIPMTGLVRAEWAFARMSQIIPTNWAHGEIIQWMDTYIPMNLPVAEARNLCVRNFIEGGWEWLFFIDHDVVLPHDCFIRFNDRMQKKDVPIFGGLYFTKSVPSEPLVYREWGQSYVTDWKFGDEVWVRAIGNGCTVYHRSVVEAVYKDSREYDFHGNRMREVFKTPQAFQWDPENMTWSRSVGTEDIYFFNRVIEGNYLSKTGWKSVAKKKYPILCDTNVFCRHIDNNGKMYPSNGEEKRYAGK